MNTAGDLDFLPTELWEQIFRFACSDNGLSGRSISQVGRYFHEVCKPLKYRSLAIVGIPSAIKFLSVIESLPQANRGVENLDISLYSSKHSHEAQINTINPGYQEVSRQIVALLNVDGTELEPSVKEASSDARHYELRVQLVIRILRTVAPSLQELFISFAQVPRRKFFLPILFPCLSELVLLGPMNPRRGIDFTGAIFPPSLRRLRMTYHNGIDPYSIWALTPGLTHFRLDCEWTPNFVNETALVRYLGPSQTETVGMSIDNSSHFSVGIPHALQCFIVFLESKPMFAPYDAIPELQIAQQSLEELFGSDEKLFIQRGEPGGPPWSYYRVEELRYWQDWLTRLEGNPVYWEVVASDSDQETQ